MTTIDDTISAVLANPLDGTGCCALLDRLAEETDDARAAALTLVLKHPENDGPRLVYAEWCERNGDKQRAEFVRVQVKLARMEAWAKDQFLVLLESRNGQYIAALRRRERELLFASPADGEANGINWLPDPLFDLLNNTGRVLFPDGDSFAWRRGFVESLTCTAADWLAVCDALFWHPARKCRWCAGTGVGNWSAHKEPIDKCPDCHGFGIRPCPKTAQPIVSVRLTTEPHERDFGTIEKMDWVARTATYYRWPGVTFEVPNGAVTMWGIGPIAAGDFVELVPGHVPPVARPGTVRRHTSGTLYGVAETGGIGEGDVRVLRFLGLDSLSYD